MARQRRAGGGVDRLPSGRFRVRIVSPEGERLSIGSFTTRRAAETAYARSLADRADGKWRAPIEATITLEEYAPGWIEERLTSRGEPLRPRVKDMYRSQLRLHIFPTLGSIPVSKITTARVRSWSAEKRGLDGPGASTAAKCYRLLRSIMMTATEDGLLAANPCNIKGAGVEPAEERPIPTVAQVHAIAETIHPRYRCIVLLAGFVGLRKGELLGLRRCDLDLDAGELSVVQQRQLDRHGQHLVGPPKTAAGKRTIALPASLIPDLQHHLDEYAEPGRYGYVFTGQQATRSPPTSYTAPGHEPGQPTTSTTSTSTTSATWPAPSPPAPAPAPRSSCTATATPAPKPPSATSTPRGIVTRPSPTPSTR